MSGDPTFINCSRLRLSPGADATKSPKAANGSNSSNGPKDEPKLRSACDGCHAAKIRCSGEVPCTRCAREKIRCHYSYKAKIGKPKGSLNKKTIERLRQLTEEGHAAAPAVAPGSTAQAEPLDSAESGLMTDDVLVSLPPDSHDHQPPSDAMHAHVFSFGVSPSESLFYGDDWLPMVTEADSIDKDTRAIENASAAQSFVGGGSGGICGASGPDMDVPVGQDDDATFWHSSSHFSLLSPYSLLSPPAAVPSSSFHDTHSTPTGSSSPPSSTCSCFSTLSNCLCHLQATTRASRQARAMDALLTLSQCVMPSLRSLFDCRSCMQDTQGLMLANMVLSRLLHWTQLSVTEQSTRQVSAQVRLGKYTASREQGIRVTRLLLHTHCIDLKKTVDRFQHRVDQISHDRADRNYLMMQARNFQQDLKRLDEESPGGSL